MFIEGNFKDTSSNSLGEKYTHIYIFNIFYALNRVFGENNWKFPKNLVKAQKMFLNITLYIL